MSDGFKNVYVVEMVDKTVNFHSIVGIYEAEGPVGCWKVA